MRYIGTKTINAQPMTRAAYNEFRGWTLPAGESGADEGYLVEYLDGGKPNVPTHAGYVSWSPKEQFDKAYRPCEAMTFGLALEAIKGGQCVARAGWNGKGMFVYLNKGAHAGDPPALFGGVPGTLFDVWDDGIVNRMPNLNMRAADGSTVTGWLASQTDLLAEDWTVV